MAKRIAGVLLHPTSLPSAHGIGDLGPAAHRFVDWLERAGQSIWQVLPLHPVDEWGSPYAAPSAFAGDPRLISLDSLCADGWLRPEEVTKNLANAKAKSPLLGIAADRIASSVTLPPEPWRDDWALFAAIADQHGTTWTSWPATLANRDPVALAEFRDAHQASIDRHAALQWAFDQQWDALRSAARQRGISLWGDCPIFVGHASADVWAGRHRFRLDETGLPSVITGVPPDAFSATGQCWEHPHYDLDAHRAEDWSWWRARLARLHSQCDIVRLDHFRGLCEAWSIPYGDEDATGGVWEAGAGAPLLEAIRDELGTLPLIAEDLGIITEDVTTLRDAFELPGMAVLQFGFDAARTNPHHPRNHRDNQVVYPGTHDNDTVAGWLNTLDASTRARVCAETGESPQWGMCELAWRSVANTAIIAAQDLCALGSEARMNRPGQRRGNWAWRLDDDLDASLADRVRAETLTAGRIQQD